jgi:hypothetical protein
MANDAEHGTQHAPRSIRAHTKGRTMIISLQRTAWCLLGSMSLLAAGCMNEPADPEADASATAAPPLETTAPLAEKTGEASQAQFGWGGWSGYGGWGGGWGGGFGWGLPGYSGFGPGLASSGFGAGIGLVSAADCGFGCGGFGGFGFGGFGPWW